MPTVARSIEAETRRAWETYADRLIGLEGEEYDRAEQDAWTHLQTTLDALGAGEVSLAEPPVG